jgi:DNA-3-methyladenine glycosylase I
MPLKTSTLARSALPTSLRKDADGVVRCFWCGDDPLYQRYHDQEWGWPLHGENRVFEKITLEGMQAGLSWITILRKRETFRAAYRNFDIEKVAAFGARDLKRLMADAGVIRNRAKIESAIHNAKTAAALLDAGTSLDALVWSFAPQAPKGLRPVGEPLAATSPESIALSKALLKLGFRFVGPTTMYALMQSAGLVNDHFKGCQRLPHRPS